MLIVLSGPSGVGKDAVLSRMAELGKPYHFAVTATTRPKRPAERDGVDYFFITEEKFRQMVDSGDLLEWAEVYGNYYGIPKTPVAQALEEGRDVIVRIDVQGATTIKKQAPEALFIFLAPPDIAELERRLSGRMTESPEALKLRLETVEREMQEASKFDYVVVNSRGHLDDAVKEIERIIHKERGRKPPRRVAL